MACVVDSRHSGVWGKGWIRGGSEEWEPDIETKKLASMEYYSGYTSSPVRKSEGTLALGFCSPSWRSTVASIKSHKCQGETFETVRLETKSAL